MPPPWPDMSGALLAMKALLVEGSAYEDALQGVRDQFDDGIALERAAYVYTAERESLDGFPAIELFGFASEVVGAGQQNVQQYRHGVQLALHQLGDDTEVVTHQVLRHILALRRLFWARILEDVADSAPLIPGREDFEPVMREKDGAGPYQKTGTLQIWVPTYE